MNQEEWIDWTLETLPDPGEKVIICYQSGYMGMIEFFRDKDHKEMYIRALIWNKNNPNADLGKIGNIIKELDNDPIIAWMPAPKLPIKADKP